ncbi:MAG: ImmA/IrrE family metallo-endopeptidase [Oryzomonas sp.]|uniref:ImmA/IrrE family metallo-endopeptidase n=1 Tax=Oryzomonas sp. TaxID=2855186 RepID=UPI00284E27EB|nr:ImmA/IrrE family metallo-endopeptidase [Oryzomonas sp.]MDR3580094.1 ImmA/IrrE family metallo-endopeptidase [Oryzomonas sp.]
MSQKINPKMITLARESRGLTQGELAKRIGEVQNRTVTQGTVSKIEQGLIGVSEDFLDGVVKVTKYRESFFYQTDEVYSAGMSQHRKRVSLPAKALCKIDAITNIYRLHIKSFLKSVEGIEIKVPYYDIDEHYDPCKIARMVRQAWLLPRGPVDNLTRYLEKSGIIVVHCDFDTNMIDGVTINVNDRTPPIIFVNKNIPGDRLRFTLCHELGHIVMHKYPSEDMEKEADMFASELLMPEADIKPSLAYLSLHKLSSLKLYWKVAMSALIYRAAKLGQITERQTKYLYMQLSKAGYRTREPAELDIPKETPMLLKRLINIHMEDLSYTVKDLATIVHYVDEDECCGLYLEKSARRPALSVVK